MRQKILKQVGVLLTVSILLTFLVVSLTMYSKFNGYMHDSVREEAEYIRVAIEETEGDYLNEKISSNNVSDKTNGRGTCRFLCFFFCNTQTLKKAVNAFALQEGVQTLLLCCSHILQRLNYARKQVCRGGIVGGSGLREMVNRLTVANRRETYDMFLHARIDMNEPRAAAFHAVESFCFPALLANPAINRLPGNAQTLRQLFRGHFAP